jgi:REP element-mobilizing transposase RayT
MERGHPCPHEREARRNVMSSDKHQPRGWHSRGYLPHFDAGEIFQTITFRLHDSMPQNLLEKWRRELTRESPDFEDELRYRIEAYLDRGCGACYLADKRIAELIQNALLYFDGDRYRLCAWVVMPNHVHLLAAPCVPHSLSGVMHSIKSYTAQQANKILGRTGRFWFEDYFDRYIRNEQHYENAVSYIINNPVRAGLCKSFRDWQFSSAWFSSRDVLARA